MGMIPKLYMTLKLAYWKQNDKGAWGMHEESCLDRRNVSIDGGVRHCKECKRRGNPEMHL